MLLSIGDNLGHYQILSPLGAGGMGEVYRAHDTKLDRDVAIKVLPRSLANDPERLARFDREAKILAALNHPNIGVIYGLVESGSGRALVMELVEGETLTLVIERGPMSIKDTCKIGRQIAEALEAAHERGVVHRDLKPGNIMVTPAGVVKVLDFGLAAMVQAERATPADASNSPTLSMRASMAGVILGTASYMSPEQTEGLPVDKRADIWSFGVVLWEMLTGKRLFEGKSVSHTLADVLRMEIDFSVPSAPAPIRKLLERCLERQTPTKLTFTAPGSYELAWAPDSMHIMFGDGTALWWVRADGSGQPLKLLDNLQLPRPVSLSSAPGKEGRLAFIQSTAALPGIFTVPVDLSDPERPKAGKVEPFLTDLKFSEVDPSFSPDGKFLAYSSAESGPIEAFVRPFPGPGGKWRISTNGGQFPAWSRATHEILFLDRDDHIMAVKYTSQGDTFSPGIPYLWSPTPVRRMGMQQNFDLSPDGKRVVMFPRPATEQSQGTLHVTFLLNFFDELRRRAPADK